MVREARSKPGNTSSSANASTASPKNRRIAVRDSSSQSIINGLSHEGRNERLQPQYPTNLGKLPTISNLDNFEAFAGKEELGSVRNHTQPHSPDQQSDAFKPSFDDIAWIKTPRRSSISSTTMYELPSSAFPPVYATSFPDKLDPFEESAHSRSIGASSSISGEINGDGVTEKSKSKSVEKRVEESMTAASKEATAITRHSTTENNSPRSVCSRTKVKASSAHRSRSRRSKSPKKPLVNLPFPSLGASDDPTTASKTVSEDRPKHKTASSRRSSLNAAATDYEYGYGTPAEDSNPSGFSKAQIHKQKRRSSLNNLSFLDTNNKQIGKSSSRSVCDTYSVSKQQPEQRWSDPWSKPQFHCGATTSFGMESPYAPKEESSSKSPKSGRRSSLSSKGTVKSSIAKMKNENSIKLGVDERPGQQQRRSTMSNLTYPESSDAFSERNGAVSYWMAIPHTKSAATDDMMPKKHATINSRERLSTPFSDESMEFPYFAIAEKALDLDTSTGSRKQLRRSSLKMTPNIPSESPRRESNTLLPLGQHRASVPMAPLLDTVSPKNGIKPRMCSLDVKKIITVADEEKGVSGDFLKNPAKQRRRSSLSHWIPESTETVRPVDPVKKWRERRHSMTGSSNCDEIGTFTILSDDVQHSMVTQSVEWPTPKSRRKKVSL